MITRVKPDESRRIDIFYEGDENVTEVCFENPDKDLKWVLNYFRRGDKRPYSVPLREEKDNLIWTVTLADTAKPGMGIAQLVGSGKDQTKHSGCYSVFVGKSLVNPGDVPAVDKAFLDKVAKEAAEAYTAAGEAKSAASFAGAAAGRAETALKTLEDGIASGDFRGEKGEKGDKGDPGPQGPKGEAGPAGDTTAADAAAEAAKEAAQEAQKAAEDCAGKVSELKGDIAAVSAVCGTLENTEDGTVIQLTDCAERPLKGLRIFGRTVQDGTPTPEAPVELASVGDSGGIVTTVAGKNLANVSGTFTSNGITHTVDATGQITSVGTLEGGYNYTNINPFIYPNFNMVGTFTLSVNKVLPHHLCIKLVYIDNTHGDIILNAGYRSKKFTISKEVFRYYFYFGNMPFGSKVNITYTLQLELGGDATDYEPYITPQTLHISTPNGLPGIPVTSGGNYTDASGQQWICDEVDFGRGVYVQRVHKQILNGSEEWINSWLAEGLSGVRPSVTIVPDIIYETATYKTGIVMCNKYPVVKVVDTWKGIKGVSVSNLGSRVNFYDSDHNATIGTWKAYLSENPVTIMCLLVTPIETPLSAEELAAYAAIHTNKPNTTIYNDAGAQMEVSYQADTKMYIDKQFAELRNAIVSLGGNV